MKYKNCGYRTQTFYGIDLAPNEVKDFPGYINARGVIRIFESKIPNTKISKSIDIEKPEEKPKEEKKSKRSYTRRATKPSINKTTQSSKPSGDAEVKDETENSEEK